MRLHFFKCLEDLEIYVKDRLGNYQLMDVRSEDVDCLTKRNRRLDPQKNLFKNYFKFAVDPIVYNGENQSNQTIVREAVLVIRLTKEFADKKIDVIRYQMPFKIIKY